MNIKMIKKTLLAVIICCSISLLIKSQNIKPENYQLVIVETSDIHGSIFNYDFINQRTSFGSLSKVQTFVNQLRENNSLVLLDNGDILQGQPSVYYYNYENTSDMHLVSKVYNYMNYDAATMGNHDIEAGHGVYDKIVEESNFPWMAANAINIADGKPYFKPYTIIVRDGIKIAVLGLITPGIPKWLPEELWSGIEFNDMVESAKKWVPYILEKEKPDLLVGLFHSGFDYTYGNVGYDSHKNENASKVVAEQVPGFDIIFVGHDHRTWNERVKSLDGSEVLVMGPTSSGRQVAKAEINFQRNNDGTYIKSIVGEIIEMKDYVPDSAFNIAFQKEFEEVKTFVSRKVGDFNKTVDSHYALYGPSEFMDLIHDVQLEIANAEISFAAPLSFGSVIKEGPVYVSDMFKLYRFENFLYTMKLTGKEIDNYLEYSFGNWYNTMYSADDHLLRFNTDSAGKPLFSEKYNSYSLKNNYYNFDVASGIKYTVDVSKNTGDMVNIISMANGETFYLDSIYHVAINSYRGNGGGGHLEQGAGIQKDEIKNRIIKSTEKDLRFYLMKWIEDKGIIEPKSKNEWKVIPEEWWLKSKEKDKQLLNTK